MEFSKARNQSLEEVEGVLRRLFDAARVDVRLSTGLSTDLFGHPKLRAAITDCLHRLPSEGKPFRILFDAGIDHSKVDSATEWWFGNPKVECRESSEHVPHMFIVDSETFRLEDQHAPDVEQRSNMMVVGAPSIVVRPVIREFDKLFSHARPYQVLLNQQPAATTV